MKAKHGHHTRKNGKSSEYITWDRMKSRCHNPNDSRYKYYGAKGISVCDRWRESFQNFLEDVGNKPSPKHTLDRYPNKVGNYEPSNCRWATTEQQQRNRTSNFIINYDGKSLPLVTWAETLGIDASTIRTRIVKLGWPIGDALITAVRSRSIAQKLPQSIPQK